MNNQELWTRALSEIELSVSRANFVTWFKDTKVLDQKEGAVVVAVPNGFSKEWLENKYHKFILKSIRALVPEVRSVSYSIVSPDDSGAGAYLSLKTKPKKEFSLPAEEQLEFKEFAVDPKTNLNPKYTFETFIVGSFNELAHAAALAVTQNLGRAYNPLFIYGGVGLGKTHLLQAVGNSIIKENRNKKVIYITSERFSNELVSSLQNNTANNFKEKYREYDLLIVDDVQFFAGKTKTQEEFFYTFNALFDAGKQVVFSSDRPPKSIQDIEERLRSRLEAGATVDISEPEYETRLAILKSKAVERKMDISEDCLELIASVVQKNIRELEGALNTIQIQSKYQNKTLSFEEIKSILNKTIKPKSTITPTQIIKTIAEFFDIPEKSIFEKTRKTEIVRPRQIAMYLIREDLKGSYPYIGQKFGGMDHTTAIHAYEKVSEELKRNPGLEDEIKSIREKYQKLKS